MDPRVLVPKTSAIVALIGRSFVHFLRIRKVLSKLWAAEALSDSRCHVTRACLGPESQPPAQSVRP